MNEMEITAYLESIGFDDEVQVIDLPHGPHVYCLFGDDAELVYVGRTEQLLARVGTHVRRHSRLSRLLVIKCLEEREATVLERLLIQEFQPRLNTTFTHRDRLRGVAEENEPKRFRD
jgi:excinuclease UvrABC nuclease subunit